MYIGRMTSMKAETKYKTEKNLWGAIVRGAIVLLPIFA